ncbi:MAG: hypothetical protein JWS12_103 [Candidatus Saccharibacteria bacterium]|nr:hypothetical protein [Candidatus Saccharibacteria bacterium]
MLKKLAIGLLTLGITLMPLARLKVAHAAAPNLIANPSMETAASATAPANWTASNWGTNTAAFSYESTGHTGSHSLKATVSAYTTGDAKWLPTDVAVTPGITYDYNNWYQSNVDTEVDAQVTATDGTFSYFLVAKALASPSAWAKADGQFTAPANAKSVTFFQVINKVGYMQIDDASMSVYTPTPFAGGLVSVTLDDGWTNQYTNAKPVFDKYGIKATYFIISGSLTDQPDYMSAAQVQTLHNDGNEIGSHTITHPDLTTMTQAQITNEMSQSQTTLQSTVGVPVTDFAYPFGAYNAATLATGKQYYHSQRSVNAGYNTKDNWDITQLKIHEVDSNISQAEVKGWIDGAIAQKSWLILVYHEIATTPTDPTDALYTTQPADLDAEMAYLKNSGVPVVTVAQALAQLEPQVNGQPVVKPGDVNGDNAIDALDLSLVLSNWNKTGATKAQGDLNADGVVDALDLSTVLANWSK